MSHCIQKRATAATLRYLLVYVAVYRQLSASFSYVLNYLVGISDCPYKINWPIAILLLLFNYFTTCNCVCLPGFGNVKDDKRSSY